MITMAKTLTADATPSALAKESKVTEEFMVMDEKARPRVAHNLFSNDIPVISIAGIDEDFSGGRRSEIRRKVAAAAEEWGVFQVVDHGIDPHLLSQMMLLSKEFFALPHQDKIPYQASPGSKGGLIFSSHLKGEAIGNWREYMIFYTHPINGRDYSKWPKEPEEWHNVVDAYAEKQMELASKFIYLLSECMDMNKDELIKAMMDPNLHVVTNHYPICPRPELAFGLKRHTDPSCITLLYQDHVGGLQATKDDGNTWVTVRPMEDALVLIIGDALKYMSNGRFKSADHQAIVNAKETRMSLTTFVHPDDEAMIYPLNLKQGEKSLLEEPMTYSAMRKMIFDKYIKGVKDSNEMS